MNGFISRRQFAALVGVKTATVGSWDRRGRGVAGRGPIYINATNVVYREEDVEKFLNAMCEKPAAFVGPRERSVKAAGRLGKPPFCEPSNASAPVRTGLEGAAAVPPEPLAEDQEGKP